MLASGNKIPYVRYLSLFAGDDVLEMPFIIVGSIPIGATLRSFCRLLR